MKKTGLLLIGTLLMMGASMVSCDKDDDKEFENKVTYEGTEYELNDGYLEYYGVWGDSTYNFDITLVSSDVDYNVVSGIPTGTGNIIYFELFSSSSTELVPGTYVFDPDGTSEANTFDEGNFALNFNFTTETGLVRQISLGSLIVEKEGSTYKLTIDCTDSAGKKITGNYEGTLSFADWSGSKSMHDRKK